MYYKTLLKNGAILIAASMLTITACKKSSNSTTNSTPALTSADDNGGYASDAAKLETTSNDVISISDAAATSGTTNLRTTLTYPTVTFTTAGSDTVMTINYGTGHVCIDGKTRSGEIIVSYNGPYKAMGTVRNISYSSYFVNGNQVTGSKVVTNEGANDSGQVYYDVVVNDSMILSSDSVITWTGHRTRTWLAGYSTPTRTDDVYSIADAGGTSTVLTRANGHVFTFTITTPLTVALDCANIEDGVLDISSTTFTGGDRILDYSYGTGGCDDLAQLTIGTHTYVIYLH